MNSSNLLERNLAKVLDNFPQIKQVAKTTYHYLKSDRNFKIALHPQVTILTPFQWAGVESTSQELFFGYYDKSPWSSDMSKMVFHRFQDNHKLDLVVFDRLTHQATVVGTTHMKSA